MSSQMLGRSVLSKPTSVLRPTSKCIHCGKEQEFILHFQYDYHVSTHLRNMETVHSASCASPSALYDQWIMLAVLASPTSLARTPRLFRCKGGPKLYLAMQHVGGWSALFASEFWLIFSYWLPLGTNQDSQEYLVKLVNVQHVHFDSILTFAKVCFIFCSNNTCTLIIPIIPWQYFLSQLTGNDHL